MATAGRKGAAKTKVRRKEKKNVVAGQAHIKSTFNNTIITITHTTGAAISWAPKARVSRPRSPRRWPRSPPGAGPWSTA